MLGGEKEEIIYLRAQERMSSFLNFLFHPHISQIITLPQESGSEGTF